ncbi:MAG: Crp/Fnr family transcriptional regulator, partial [Pseudomonadota bacterium]
MDSLAADLRQMRRTPLHDEHVEAIRAIATEEVLPAGQAVTRTGEPVDRFICLLEGRIDVLHPVTGKPYLESGLGPTQFVGDISFLSGGAATMTLCASEPCRALVVPRAQMLTLMSQVPEMSDIIITVFAARRRRQLEDRDSSLLIVGAEQSPDVQRVAAFLSRNRIP